MIFHYLSARDLSALEGVSKSQQILVRTSGWLEYFRQRGFLCSNDETKQQLMAKPTQFGPRQLIRLLGLDRWMDMIQCSSIDPAIATKGKTFIDFEKMGNRSLAFWTHENLAYLAIRYISESSEGCVQGLVVFCQRPNHPQDWWVKSSCDPEELCKIFGILGGPVYDFPTDDRRWDYFNNLLRGKVCGTGPQASITDIKISLWKSTTKYTTLNG